MFEIQIGSLNVLVGPPPAPEMLLEAVKRIPDQYFQYVFLSPQNLVQMCNFVRRCRNEMKKLPVLRKYFVFLQFQAHREVWHLLEVYKELGWTLVLFGGPCVSSAIKEIVDQYTPTLILEWYGRTVVGKMPLLCVVDMRTKEMGVLGFRGITLATDAAETAEQLVERIVREWMARNPLNRKFSSVGGAVERTMFSGNLFNPMAAPPTPPQPPKHATATMNLALACSLLGISQAECMNQEAIKKAYRKKAMELHPDKQRANTHDAFTRIGEAKRYLTEI